MVGARLRVDGHLSRTGVQIYDQGDGTVRREQRDAAEVFCAPSLASMRAMPVTVGHPDLQMVTADNWRTLARGHVGDDVRRADDGIHTQASIWILDAETQRRVTSGDLVELSVGYFAELEEQGGRNDAGEEYDARQTQIRGNHLALLQVDQARGGRGCRLRLDSMGDAHYITDPAMGQEENKRMKIKIKADGYDHEIEADSDSIVTALEKDRARSQAIIDEMRSGLEKIQAQLDAETNRAKDLETKLAAETDPAVKNDAIEKAIKLRSDARRVAGDKVDLTGTPEQVRRAALLSRGLDLADKSDTYVEARFDAELERAASRSDALGAARLAAVGDPDQKIQTNVELNLAEILADRLVKEGA